MKKFLLLLIPGLLIAANEPINVNSLDGKVKETSSTVGSPGKPFDFSDVNVIGIGGGGGAVSITGTAPIIVTPSPITGTGVISINSSAFEVPITFSMSLVRATNTVTLVNDSASPGASKYYGTDGTSAKGWFALPAAGGVSSFNTRTGAVVSATNDYSFAQLSGDFALTQTPSATASRLIGRGAGSAGDWQEITVGSGLSMTGTTLAATAGGGGTVTDFSAGDLSPLFTTTEATTTTTPALSFALSNAPTFSWFGNNTGSPAAPAYNITAFPAVFIPAFTGDVTKPNGSLTQTLANIPATTTIGGAAGARGDVLYYGASGWAKLAAGTNGNQLTTHAAGADPTWDAPGSGGGAPTGVDYLVGTADGTLSAEIVVGLSPGGELGGTWASPTIDDFISVTGWTLLTPTIGAMSNLTTNGFVKTGGGIGTLSVDTATYQPSDADLTTFAGITPTTVGQSFLTLANPGAITFPEISATNVVSAKTAAQLKTDLSLTATDVGLGNVTNNAQTQAAIVPNTAPSAGQILIGNAGNTAYAKNSLSGSGATMSLGATGVLTISAIPETSLSITDVTTGNATTSAHGFAPKGTVGTTQFWRQDWTLATPGGTGTVTATGGALTANSVVLGAGTTDTKVVSGIITDGTSKLTLGVAGTSVGSVDFKNATSGTVTILPATGALGTVSMTLPAANSNPVVPDTGAANNFLTAISSAGVISKAQPAFSNLTGNWTVAQAPTSVAAFSWFGNATGGAGAPAFNITAFPAVLMPALTGDVTTTAGSLATTIGANKVTLPMLATMATDSILGRATAATGNVEVLTSLPFAWSGGDVARAADSNTETINTNAVTYAKMQDVTATSRFLGRITAGAGDPEELTAANAKTILALTSSDVGLGNVTNNAQTQSAIVPNTAPSAGQILAGNAGGTAYAPVTVSGSGATISLASTGVMTIGSIANASLDSDLAALGNISGVRGDVLFYGASGWAKLGVGTSGQQLTTGGAGADPSWAAAGSGGAATWGTITGTLSAQTDLQTALDGKQPVDGDLTELAAITGAQGDVIYHNGTDWVKLGAGTNGNQLTTHSTGANPTWDAPGAGGSGTPGGSDTHVQFNDAGAFGGDTGLVFDKTNNVLTLLGSTTTPTLKVGVLELQSYAVNNAWFGDNTYFDGSSFKYRAAGTSGMFYFYDSEGQFRFAGAGSAGGSIGTFVQAKFNATGTVAFGGDISEVPATYTNARMIIYGDGVSTGIAIPSNYGLSWSGTANDASAAGGYDTGLWKNAAGVVEVNNGTAGQYRDIKVDEVDAVTGYKVDGISTSADFHNSSVTNQAGAFASDTYLTGSNIVLAAGDFKAKAQYHCVFDITKTNAGTATPIISVRVGTTGTVASDPAVVTMTFGAGTAVVDLAVFEVFVTFRTVGSGTSAVVAGFARGQHNLATTGMFNNAAVWATTPSASSGFNSSTATTIGVSFNGGSSFSGTATQVRAKLTQ